MDIKIYEDTPADVQIKSCINNYQNFTVVAGAGSGKTGSLIKALGYVRHQHGKILRSKGQQIACITYTNIAVDVIKQRTNLDGLFFISTIHSFLWGLVASYQNDIRDALENELIPNRIAKKKEDDEGQSQKAIKAREQILRFSTDLKNLTAVKQFSYNDGNRRDYSSGYLNHDDVIDLVSIMISKLPMLRRIIGQKFPYIFIDEAQDTFPNVMEALNSVAQINGLPIIGYFGDPMQQIYDNRAGEFMGPEGAVVITKLENYRCSTEVIKLLNVIRPSLQQQPGQDNVTGSVEIRLIQAEKGTGNRNTYSDEQISKALIEFDKAVDHFEWTESNKVKQLFLTWQMIAHRLGFSKINHLFTAGIYASAAAEDAYKKGTHFVLQPFVDIFVPLIEANAKADHNAVNQIMRKHNSPILDPKGINEFARTHEVIKKVQTAIDDLVSVWFTSSIREILVVARKHGLIAVSEHLAEQLDRPVRTEEYDETKYGQEKGDWLIDEILTYQTKELAAYRSFIFASTPFDTQHGVKGEEFERVLVVFDDTEANWNNFSFSRLLTPITAGNDPTEGQRKRSLNLAYVCFSRAIQDLRIILFTANPVSAKKELLDKGLFAENQISIQLR